MKEIKKVENKLLDRTEYVFEMESSSVPSRDQVKQDIVKKLKADENLVSIEEINSHYGTRTIHISVYVYESEDVKNRLVAKYIAKRNAPAQVESEE